jgi:Na+-driven multidrug efflux pump
MKQRVRIPKKLFAVIAILLVLGLVAGPIINSLATEEQMSRNVLLSALPFILIFAAIILTFIAVIVMVASALNNQIAPRTHKIIEYCLIAGIVLGVFGMFQPWWFAAYTYGFLVLLFSTLGFILWSHVSPKREQHQEEIVNMTTNP